MPKLLDHSQREVEVAEAAWRVLRRDGVTKLSVRNVAAEAGLATGSLRRAFPTQDALLAFSLELVARRARARIEALPQASGVREGVEVRLFELIPLDDERRAEMDAYFTIGAMASTRPALAPSYRITYDGLREGCRRMLSALEAEGLVRSGLDLDLEAQHLHALVDGIALHLVQPGESAERSKAIIRTHLDRLE
ncbi:TetR/AcrR family transcriptional regulator [Agreia sp. COWG]|uniref:TetR/AcrR family transcriptional regulator n=1 Tax=Agreia sp. COWG TaxID=2773266 RepID=UPI00192790D7|nr:TetR family transcriptional regulator C-terminal domain-containing protein [Agreia sp. COWG]CAD6009782.1 HTH tetR-type domain-containing protein [Agreia sp. COWG]